MIAGEVGKQDVMNPLVEQFGVRFLPGVLVQVKQDIQPDLMIVKPRRRRERCLISFKIC